MTRILGHPARRVAPAQQRGCVGIRRCRIGGGQPFGDGQAGAVVLVGGAGVPDRDREIAQLVVADAQVAWYASSQ
jgi:hypothetical protein